MSPSRKRRILAALAILLLFPFVVVLALLGWGWTEECITNRLSVVDVRPPDPPDTKEQEEIHVRISVRRGEDLVIWEGRPEPVARKIGFYMPFNEGHYVIETRFSSGVEPRIKEVGYVTPFFLEEAFVVIGEHEDFFFEQFIADTYLSSGSSKTSVLKLLFFSFFDRLSCVEKLVERAPAINPR